MGRKGKVEYAGPTARRKRRRREKESHIFAVRPDEERRVDVIPLYFPFLV